MRALLLTLLCSLTLTGFTQAVPDVAGFTPNRYASAVLIVPDAAYSHLATGDTLFALDETDALVGRAFPDENGFAFTLWADDPYEAWSPEKDGLLDGEQFRLFSLRDGTIVSQAMSFDPEYQDLPYFGKDSLYVLSSLSVSANTLGFSAASASPPRGSTVTVDVRVVSDAPLAAVQVDLRGGGSVVPSSLPSGWTLSQATLSGGRTRFVLEGLGSPLPAGTQRLFQVSVLADAPKTLRLTRPIGSRADGLDAALNLGVSQFTVTPFLRGDVTANGVVDVADFSAVIDLILAEQTSEAGDLFPFPVGDDSLDVRDLVVLGRAVLTGSWPDGLPTSGIAPTQARTSSLAGTINLTYSDGHLVSPVRLRAVQGRARADSVSAVSGTSVLREGDDFLFYRLSSEGMSGEIGYVGAPIESITDLKGVDENGAIVELALSFSTLVDPDPLASTFRVFPNPTGSVLNVSGVEGTVVVLDVLGRRILTQEVTRTTTLDLSTLPPGQYFVRSERTTLPFTIAR